MNRILKARRWRLKERKKLAMNRGKDNLTDYLMVIEMERRSDEETVSYEELSILLGWK
ncbi:hypothetical protein SAMN04487996_119171 [Dyadobacter soli]|uniref:Uncharacterized protein n=1 Tax=Dyadobacter soli TaxID=659014 RepID=A0A1G7V0L2_9BACT|nr:hypothetical protein SAMN04487996_119171 [Dyadobacter soli]